MNDGITQLEEAQEKIEEVTRQWRDAAGSVNEALEDTRRGMEKLGFQVREFPADPGDAGPRKATPRRCPEQGRRPEADKPRQSRPEPSPHRGSRLAETLLERLSRMMGEP